MHHLLIAALLLSPAAPVVDEGRLHTDRAAVRPTLPEEDEAFSFVVFGDRTGGPDAGIAVLEQAVRDTNLLDPDFVMTVGDLIQGYNARPAWLVQMNQYKATMAELNMPWFPVAGNHDIYWRGPGRPDIEHEADFEQWFGPLWYAFDHKDCRFIVLYTDEGDPETTRRSFGDPDAQRMSPEQFDWLNATLENAADRRHVFVFMHHPRWRGGGYGDDWDKVHALLVEAGNVSAVFAGHVHRLRHDGPIDGIEYLSLATVGGHLPEVLPEAGLLDHTLQVMVRDEGIAMAALPVGGVLDPASQTAEHHARIKRARSLRPSIEQPTQDVVQASWHNTLDVPVTIDVHLDSADHRWHMAPDHAHVDIEPGATAVAAFAVHHPVGPDRFWDVPRVVSTVRFTSDERAWRVSGATVNVPMDVDVTAGDWSPAALDVRGAGGLRVHGLDDAIPADASFTLEAWVRPRDLAGRRGLVTKTENAEYGLFVTDATPYFAVHLNGGYTNARARAPLAMNTWHHVAGVWDGTHVSLYVNGRRVAHDAATGPRTRNTLPLVIGGDVDSRGEIMSSIDGEVDAVRLSRGVLYQGESFTPDTRPEALGDTVLLMHMHDPVGPYVPATRGPQAVRTHGASVVDQVDAAGQ